MWSDTLAAPYVGIVLEMETENAIWARYDCGGAFSRWDASQSQKREARGKCSGARRRQRKVRSEREKKDNRFRHYVRNWHYIILFRPLATATFSPKRETSNSTWLRSGENGFRPLVVTVIFRFSPHLRKPSNETRNFAPMKLWARAPLAIFRVIFKFN